MSKISLYLASIFYIATSLVIGLQFVELMEVTKPPVWLIVLSLGFQIGLMAFGIRILLDIWFEQK